MNWTPESTDALSTTLDANALEESTAKIWHEFFAGYFDGMTHSEIVYPAAQEVLVNIKPFARELDGFGIQIVSSIENPTRDFRQAGQRHLQIPGRWQVYVKAQVGASGAKGGANEGMNSDALCRRASDLLYGLLQKPNNLLPVIRTGIASIRANTPSIVPAEQWVTRRITLSATIRVAI